jgi:hypothetical protein
MCWDSPESREPNHPGELPSALENPNALQAFRNVLNRYYEINETLDSREQWRQNHQAMSNFETRLEKLDQVLITQVERLDRELRQLRHFGLGDDVPLEPTQPSTTPPITKEIEAEVT